MPQGTIDMYLKKAEFNKELLTQNGLWEQLTYQEAVDIVQNHSRNVCVRPIFPKKNKLITEPNTESDICRE
ncbi:hypothetical protein Bca4012_007914 [Brassica carinata]|uniref:Uncharacterized protein n=1 Tax=Brassica carinata TaxID=52824 RepID=A0A8X7RPY7_BRACI|nr:hypothetical protein Bca52824_038606 [Brassica carinata]